MKLNRFATRCPKPPAMSKTANRLHTEKSPYLLQHAPNPVHWQPWDQHAFSLAQELDRPIFLSIGYSTCHWCHVMERESFEDSEVAALLNSSFVSVKVDREERPDVDAVYMSVCQSMTGHGGWPLTIIMTPDKKPFFAATYLPRDSRFGRMGLTDLIPRIAAMWRERREDVLASADSILSHVQAHSIPDPPGSAEAPLGQDILESCRDQLAERFDAPFGGFGPAPKFPSPHILMFLMRHHRITGDPRVLAMVEKTLAAMRQGGIFDHVGFGFHRYSTDRVWLAPHFEKMLYDQAMLTMAYVEAFQLTKNTAYRATAEQTIQYVLRDLRGEHGAFYSAQDADSEGTEGKFYVFTLEEVQNLLRDEADLAAEVFDLLPEGNFEDEATREKTGANILHLKAPLPVVAEELSMALPELEQRVEAIRTRLYTARQQRPKPHIDDKVLTDWNGLFIAALAMAARAFQRKDLAEAAGQATDFLVTNMRTAPGTLLHRYRDGQAAIPGHLDDYAFFIWGLLELYRTTFQAEHLLLALELMDEQVELFWDTEHSGFLLTASNSEELLFRPKEGFDGALPSANSVALLNMIRLARIFSRTDLEAKADALLQAFSTQVRSHPAGFTFMLSAASLAFKPGLEVVIVPEQPFTTLEATAPSTAMLVEVLGQAFLPEAVVLMQDNALADKVAHLRDMRSQEKTSLAYVCRDFSCQASVGAPEDLKRLLAL